MNFKRTIVPAIAVIILTILTVMVMATYEDNITIQVIAAGIGLITFIVILIFTAKFREDNSFTHSEITNFSFIFSVGILISLDLNFFVFLAIMVIGQLFISFICTSLFDVTTVKKIK